MYLRALIFICVALVLYKFTRSYLATKWYQAEAAKRGCFPAPSLRSTNILGTSVLKESIAATKADRGPQYIVKAMNSIGKNVHTLRVPIFDYELLVTRDPKNIQAILSSQSADYDISATRANAFMPLLGEGLFTSRGSQWKHSRALVRPQFNKEEISNLDLVDRHVQTLLQILKSNISDKWTPEFDLQPLFFYFSLDTVTEFLYGQSVNSQSASAGLEKNNTEIDGANFAYHLDAAKHLVDKRGALGKFYWIMPLKKMRSHCAPVHKVINFLIKERIQTINSEIPISNEEKTKANGTRKFVLLDELAKETQNTLELRNETLHTLVAGRDTTGALCGWTFYLLARHPKIFTKLRDNIIEYFGSSPTSMENITANKLRACEYLQQVLHEVIRVVAIVPMNERTALRDTTLPTGGGEDGTSPIFVRKGIQILIPTFAVQHRPDLWGEDADFFRPERWENRKVTGWEWIPFGGGPRKCLGQQFALTETSLLVVRFLQSFDSVENMDPSSDENNWIEEIKLHTAIENRSGTGVHVRLHTA